MDATTTVIALSNGSFWQALPAAAYVLIGVFISGIFTLGSTIISTWMSTSSDKSLKKLENENSKKLKELENENSKEMQKLEIDHKEKIRELEEEGRRKLRLLDDRIKVFSDFFNEYSEVLLSGTKKERLERIEKLRSTVYRVRLLEPSLKKELLQLDNELLNYSNHYYKIVYSNIDGGEDERKEGKALLSKVRSIINRIFDSLPGRL